MAEKSPKSPGRPGLQRKDVADAIDSLQKRGIRDPSLAQLRQHLGRGSNGTISRLRNEIRGERLLATRTPVEGSVESSVLPVLIDAMQRLAEESAKACLAADDQITEMRNTFEAAQSKLSRERDDAVAAAHDIRVEQTTRAEQVKDLRDTIKALRAEVADERKRLDRSEDARRQLDDQTHALMTEAKNLADTRDRLEQSLAQKTDALAEASVVRDTLQSELDTLTVTNSDLASALRERTAELESGQSAIEELRQANATLEQRAVQAEQDKAVSEAASAATVTSLEARLTDGQKNLDALIAKIDNTAAGKL